MTDQNHDPHTPRMAYGPIEKAIQDMYWPDFKADVDGYHWHLFSQHHWNWGDWYSLTHMDLLADWHKAEHEARDSESEWENHTHD